MTLGPGRDCISQSSYKRVTLESTELNVEIDWSRKIVKGTVVYSLETEDPTVVLDTAHLEIFSAKFNETPVKFVVEPAKYPVGSALHLQGVPVNVKGKLAIEFATTDKCTTLQWLEPEQTESKKAPYVFSQGEPIHNRSLFPCFDTPSVKSVYHINVKSAYPVVASGNIVKSDEKQLYRFVQNVPIPSYLLAIASGNIESRPIGPRSLVWAEPNSVDACQKEFEHDTENFIKTAESIVFPYEWQTYNVLVLPLSFPFGGMENPNITFATPSLITGDRQLVDVIAHELAHSWSGNLVTSASWEHFWLNEGWTVYLERRIMAEIHGEKFRHFEALIGWKELAEAVKQLKPEFTSLVVDMKNGTVDPDDSFSTVPYEKGSTFLWHLETTLGKPRWNQYIPHYFETFKYRSLDTNMFIDSLYKFFTHPGEKEKLDAVDWKLWLHTQGLPPKPEFDTSLVEPALKLARKWYDSIDSGDASWASPDDIAGWTCLQVVVFLDTLGDLLSVKSSDSSSLAPIVRSIGHNYSLENTHNGELKSRWYRLAIVAKLDSQYQPLAQWLGTIGRMKYVRPGYRLLASVDRKLAVSTFEANQSFYHPICRGMVSKDLEI